MIDLQKSGKQPFDPYKKFVEKVFLISIDWRSVEHFFGLRKLVKANKHLITRLNQPVILFYMYRYK